jgi:hypothetical protein
MSILNEIIKLFVNNNSFIIEKYENIKREKNINNIFKKICLILILKIKYIKNKTKYSYYMSKKLRYPEAKEKVFETDCLNSCLKQNNIYFIDLFDTLLLSQFPHKSVLYDIIGCDLEIYDYRKYREDAEKKFKMKCNEDGDNNYNFDEFYTFLSKWCGIDIEKVKGTELKLIIKYYICNSLLVKNINLLIKSKFKVYAYNDSLLSNKDLKILLAYYGYDANVEIINFSEVMDYVKLSNEKKSNSVKESCNLIYYGSKLEKELKGIKSNKWRMVRSPDIHLIGEEYRITSRGFFDIELYNGIINTSLYTFYQNKSFYQKHGFVYGGLLICNFCKWLNQLARSQDIDKFLFLSRDCSIINKVYDEYYNEFDHEYVRFSRFASQQLLFCDYTEQYIEDVLRSRINIKSRKTIAEILREIDLELLMEFLVERGMLSNQIFDEKGFNMLKELIYEKKRDIIAYFEETKRAAIQYFKKIIDNRKKICIVDLGWRGTSVGYLKHFLKKEVSNDIEVIGALVGASDCKFAQNLVSSSQMFCYAFDNEIFRGPLDKKQNKMTYMEILCYEAMFSSSEDTLLKYKTGTNAEVQFIYGSNNNSKIIDEMHLGVMNFAEIYNRYKEITGRVISGKDAFMPLYQIIQNKKYRMKFLEEYYETEKALQGFGVNSKTTIY